MDTKTFVHAYSFLKKTLEEERSSGNNCVFEDAPVLIDDKIKFKLRYIFQLAFVILFDEGIKYLPYQDINSPLLNFYRHPATMRRDDQFILGRIFISVKDNNLSDIKVTSFALDHLMSTVKLFEQVVDALKCIKNE